MTIEELVKALYASRELKEIYKKAVVCASGHYLTEVLPNDWTEWDNDKMGKFVLDNAWYPFEYWDADDMWYEIGRLANDMVDFMRANEGEDNE